MCNLTVNFYTTSNRVKRASIIDNGRVLYMSQDEAKAYLSGREYKVGHENNPTAPSFNK